MLIPRFYPVMGGTENQCRLLSKQLFKMGHGVFVLTQREKNTAACETLDGVDVYRLPGFALPGIFSFGFFFSALFFLISNRVKYDLIHVHLATSAALAAVLSAAILGKGCVVKFAGAGRTGDIGTSRGKPWGRLKLYILKKSRALFTAPSDEVASELLGAGFNKESVVKISNGVECSYYSPLPQDEREALRKEMRWVGKKVFLFAGRLEEPKDIAFFLEAWAASSDERGLFVIAGEGSQEKALRALAEKKKIKNIVFAGKRNDILRFYRAADYFVLPSRAEGLSNALLEAMSCGLTVIASGIPANREVIEDGEDGFLFSFTDPGGLMDLIKEGLAGRDVTAGTAARSKIVRGYSIGSVAEKYINRVYASIANSKYLPAGRQGD
ncbi:MAG: glycosyltransferase family 4 protein [Candidatus Omnitrophota bacterium]